MYLQQLDDLGDIYSLDSVDAAYDNDLAGIEPTLNNMSQTVSQHLNSFIHLSRFYSFGQVFHAFIFPFLDALYDNHLVRNKPMYSTMGRF